MIGTEVLFEVKIFYNTEPSGSGWERKTGIIRDKIRKPYEDKFIKNIDIVIDYYVIESNGKYYFIKCDQILFK